MADLTESPTWTPGVFQLEINTPATGGPGAVMNAQAQALANRTAFLKQEVEARVPLAGGTMAGPLTLATGVYGPLDAVPRRYADALRQTLRNRIVNGAMLVSQERGTAPLDITTGTAYALDQWAAILSAAPGGTLRCQQFPLATPGGSPFRLRCTVLAADASLAANDLYAIQQPIEGRSMADARFGSAAARQLLLRLGMRASVAGTYTVSLVNPTGTRSWTGAITIAAGEVNADVVRSFAIPGDAIGAWPQTTAVGMWVRVALAAGSARTSATPGWQAGNICAVTGQANLMATLNATLDLFDVALHVDAAGLGIVPPYELPDPTQEERACHRYWCSGGAGGPTNNDMPFSAGATATGPFVPFPVPMRDTPAMTFTDLAANASRFSDLYGGVHNQEVTTGSPVRSPTPIGFLPDFSATGSALNRWRVNWIADARM